MTVNRAVRYGVIAAVVVAAVLAASPLLSACWAWGMSPDALTCAHVNPFTGDCDSWSV